MLSSNSSAFLVTSDHASSACEEATAEVVSLFDESIILGLISALTISLFNLGAKLAVENHGVALGYCILLRGSFGLVVMSLKCWQDGESFPPGPSSQIPLLGCTGLVTALGQLSGLYAVSGWGVAEVACIVNSSPTFTVLWTGIPFWLPLYEPLTPRLVGILLGASIGIVMVTRPDFVFDNSHAQKVSGLYVLAAFGQTFTQSACNVLIRKTEGTSVYVVTWYLQVSLLSIGLVLIWIYGSVSPHVASISEEPMQWVGLCFVAIFGICGSLTKNAALKRSKSILVVSMRYLVPCFCLLWDVIFLQMFPNTWTVIGCGVVVTFGVLLLLEKKRREKENLSEAPGMVDVSGVSQSECERERLLGTTDSAAL